MLMADIQILYFLRSYCLARRFRLSDYVPFLSLEKGRPGIHKNFLRVGCLWKKSLDIFGFPFLHIWYCLWIRLGQYCIMARIL